MRRIMGRGKFALTPARSGPKVPRRLSPSPTVMERTMRTTYEVNDTALGILGNALGRFKLRALRSLHLAILVAFGAPAQLPGQSAPEPFRQAQIALTGGSELTAG